MTDREQGRECRILEEILVWESGGLACILISASDLLRVLELDSISLGLRSSPLTEGGTPGFSLVVGQGQTASKAGKEARVG